MQLANTLLKISQAHTMSEATKKALGIGKEYPMRDANWLISNVKSILRDYELYSFSKSATYAASDLRFEILNDTFLKIAEVIFSEPRKMYLETSFHERKQAFSHIHEFNRDEEVLVSDPANIGLILTSEGDGRGSIRAVWAHNKVSSPLHLKLADTEPYSADKNKIMAIGRTNLAVYEVCVDLKGKQPLSKEEFLANKEKVGTLESEVWLNTVLNPSMRNHEEMNLEDWAYLQYKLNCYSYVRVTNENKEQYLDLTEAKGFPDLTLQKDLHGELTFAIPLFGLLLSGSLDMTPQKQRVISGKSSNRVKAKNRKSDDLEYEAGLNKCSLNLSPDLIAAQTSREHETNDNSVSDGKRKSPTLHFVRGHTFVRNGKISYRSPHWRGSVSESPTITKVKA